MLISLTSKAVRNLSYPAIIKIFFLCMAFYIMGWIAVAWGISTLITFYSYTGTAPHWMITFLSSVGSLLFAWFCFPLLYPILISFFGDKIVAIIEGKDYPNLPSFTPPFWPTFLQDLLFVLKALLLNLLCLPFYLIPPLGVIVYYALNGYLLGQQFFRMAAGRHVTKAAGRLLEHNARGSIFIVGVIISFCSTLPVINFVAPILGVALNLHLFHAIRNRSNYFITSQT